MTDNVYPIRLTRREASHYLREKHGLQYSYGTLSKMATLGGGPRFRKPNPRTAIYDRTTLDRWAEEKLGSEYGSTSEISSKN